MPGSLIVDTDQAAATLYIHVLGVPDRAEVEQFRRERLRRSRRRIVEADRLRRRDRLLDSAHPKAEAP